MVYIGLRSTPVWMGAVVFGFTLGLVVTYGLADPGQRAALSRLSLVDTAPSQGFDPQRHYDSEPPSNSGMRLASLEIPAGLDLSAEAIAPDAFAGPLPDRPVLEEQLDSFNARFDSAVFPLETIPATAGEKPVDSAQPFDFRDKAKAQSVLGRLAATPLASAAKKRVHVADLSQDLGSLPSADSRTAIYDITARTVYMPDGRRLEAHSGLGDLMDDPHAINVKSRGPTPPNVYDLTLREQLFHGVRAIRLNPVDESKMFGRDGILAHTYMLGSNGQSNGCVSFSDYNGS